MSIKIFSNTKVYIACPAYVATGGPELLHQLARRILDEFGVNTYIFYYDAKLSKVLDPVHPEYRKYDIPYIVDGEQIDDKPENILIVPEIQQALVVLKDFKFLRRGVWFLSVDNYYLSKMKKTDFLFWRVINKLYKICLGKALVDFTSEKFLKKLSKMYDYCYDELLRLADFYMCNSHRGMIWFAKLSPLYYLSEYLSEEFLQQSFDPHFKENIVAYNPKKGYNFTQKILKELEKKSSVIRIVAIENMSRDEVTATLKKAKVYIDFGNHPGRDRLPREAAILGACVITGKRGSAGNDEDLPIPRGYKFEDKAANISKIVQKIVDCIEHYEDRVQEFEQFRQFIRNEPKKFKEDLRKIFQRAD